MKRRVPVPAVVAALALAAGASLTACAADGDPGGPAPTTAPVAGRGIVASIAPLPLPSRVQPSTFAPGSPRPAATTASPSATASDGGQRVDYGDPVSVARAFAAAMLSYRWDSSDEERASGLRPYATARWLDGLGGSGRETAAWREFVAARGVVLASIRHAAVSEDAPNGVGVVHVQVVATTVTLGEGLAGETDDTALNLRLVVSGGGWLVDEAVTI